MLPKKKQQSYVYRSDIHGIPMYTYRTRVKKGKEALRIHGDSPEVPKYSWWMTVYRDNPVEEDYYVSKFDTEFVGPGEFFN